jgi:hypothetical protein
MRESIFVISKSGSVKEIQEHFSVIFPFLKINFFKDRNNVLPLSGHRVVLYSPETLMKDINPGMAEGELTIRETMNILDLENEFYEKFGLSVQILRRSGNLWLDTSRTNSWTLKAQDDLGREISPEQKNNVRIDEQKGFRRNLG